MAKQRRKRGKPDTKLYWRNGRAYGDFRAYADVGGERQALALPGKSWGTEDPEIAEALFAQRLQELEGKRKQRAGLKVREVTTLAALVQDHLVKKHRAGQTSHAHMMDLEHRLGVAIEFFGAERDPQTIEPREVREWAEALGASGRRKPGTVRHYLNALSGLYRRAREGRHVEGSYNPVAALVEKPTGRWKGEAAFLEVEDAALLLEAARIIEERGAALPGDAGNRATAAKGLYPIVGTFLLTGGRKAEVLGLDVEDISFDRGLVYFRPNRHRGLKTSTSHRTVPIWPQLEEILREWMFGGESPRTSGLLFPSLTGGMVGDLRKSLDQMSELCGMEPGEVRTRRFRHTYCSARLQTVQRIVKPGRDPARDGNDAFEYVEVSKFTVQKEMGHGGAQLVDRIYGHAQRNPHRSDVVEFRLERHREDLGDRIRALESRAR